jgi:antitoxin (DNA-binding transcriptional repressor) of toxin-antitoxin stability system
MKKVSLAQASRPLAEYASELNGDIVVVTKGNRPLAALVSLRNVDRESWSLSSHPEFLKLITRARREIAKGKSLSLEEMRTRAGGRRSPNKRLRPTVPRRHGG